MDRIEDLNFDDEDIILPDDYEEIPTSEEEGEQQEETEVEKTNDTNVETEEQQGDAQEKAFLEYLNSKDIIYNGEKVTVKDFDELINNLQKGLNYDKVKNRNENNENVVMEYIESKAKEAGLSVEQYIKDVKEYELQMKKEKEENDLKELISSGLSEQVAREVLETRALRTYLKQEKEAIEQQKENQRLEKERDKEYEDFLKAYPDIKAAEIPAEVFEAAKEGTTLLNAYRAYENKLLKEKIKQIEQNNKNASSSVVISTSQGSETNQQTKDAFLLGFDEEE